MEPCDTESSGSGRGEDRLRDDRRKGRLNSELLSAVLQGDLERVAKRLEAGASVNATCRETRTTVLQLAVVCGHVDAAHLLLCRGASIRKRDRAGRQAVHLAAATGRLLLLQLILDSDPDVVNSPVATEPLDAEDNNYLDSWSHEHNTVAEKIPDLTKGATPLHLATQRLFLDCVAELLKRGGRVDLPDDRGLTPLDVVGETPVAPSGGVLVDLADALPTDEETLARLENLKMRRRRIAGAPSPEAISMKVRIRGDPTPPSFKPTPIKIVEPFDGNRGGFGEPSSPPIELPNAFHPSDPAIVISPLSPTKTGPSVAQKVVNELINRGAKMPRSKVILKQGGVANQVTLAMTCLHTAVERQDLALVEYLMQQGACQLTWNRDGLTAVHLAVSLQLLEPLRVLLDYNKNAQIVDARDIHGRTPLHLAVEQGWLCGVNLLLEAGADIKLSSNSSNTVLHLAASRADPQLLQELLTIPDSVKILESRNNQHETPLCRAVIQGRERCVKLLLAKGVEAAILPGDITLIHLAAERGDISVLTVLLAEPRVSKDKDVRSKEGKGGTTALHQAALHGFKSCVEALLRAGCDWCALTSDYPHFSTTALHLAARFGHAEVVELIVSHNKDSLTKKDGNGWFPLHVAARFSQEGCVRYMLLNGANLAANVVDSFGNKKTALDIIVYSIIHPVSFLEDIFNASLQDNGYPLNDPKCEVLVKYGILQPLGPDRKQLKVLDTLLNCGKHIVQERLLLHPLVETFLYLKWKKLRVFLFLMMALYIVFTVSLTVMSLFYFVVMAQSVAVDACITTCRITLCISLTLITLQELLQASRLQRYYITDLESWVKWSTFILATVVVWAARDQPASWLVHVSAVAVLLAWLELLFLLSRWPSTLGFYILMFFTVAKNVLRVFATFTFAILGFTFAFMIHFKAAKPFNTWWESIVKIMVMTLEFDYGDLFEGRDGVDATSIVGRSIFLAFMFLVSIVLMNLLVGLAVSDIATLEKQGRAQRLAKQIDFLSLLELFVYNPHFCNCFPKKIAEAIKRRRAVQSLLEIEPGKPLRQTRRFLPLQLRQSVINNLTSRNQVDGTENGQKSSSQPLPLDRNKKQENESVKNEQNNPVVVLDPKIQNSLDLIIERLKFLEYQIETLETQRALSSSVLRDPSTPQPQIWRT